MSGFLGKGSICVPGVTTGAEFDTDPAPGWALGADAGNLTGSIDTATWNSSVT
jgi:hypothetical protein